jgi:hypothetical protein
MRTAKTLLNIQQALSISSGVMFIGGIGRNLSLQYATKQSPLARRTYDQIERSRHSGHSAPRPAGCN